MKFRHTLNFMPCVAARGVEVIAEVNPPLPVPLPSPYNHQMPITSVLPFLPFKHTCFTIHMSVSFNYLNILLFEYFFLTSPLSFFSGSTGKKSNSHSLYLENGASINTDTRYVPIYLSSSQIKRVIDFECLFSTI